MGVEPPGPRRQSAAALPVARIRDQKSQVGGGESVHGVERDGAFRGVPEGLEFPPEKLGRGQSMIGQVIRWRGLDSTARRGKCASDGIGPDVEPMRVLLPV